MKTVEAQVSRNLLPLVGIAILLLGVGIGVRWAIEQDYIGPVARVTLGYVAGVALLGFAERLRKSYDVLSPILLGGGMAVLYFVTYAASSYYALLPLGLAFGLMVGFTVFTVLAALRYDRQVVAHLGLVGAYAVPFLLSADGGDWTLMLAYVTVLNVGILAVSYYRAWRPLVYVTLALTYLLFGALALDGPSSATLPTLRVLAFSTANAAVILGALVARKFRWSEALTLGEALAVLLNGLLYFAVGYWTLEREYAGGLGAFALANAAVYVILGLALRRREGAGADGRGVPLLASLGLAFVAAAVPAQLDGTVVTVLWAALAVTLSVAAERVRLPVLRVGAYALLALAVVSWADDLDGRRVHESLGVLNRYFLTTLAVGAAAAGVAVSSYRAASARAYGRVAGYVCAALALALFFAAGMQEIHAHFALRYHAVYEGTGAEPGARFALGDAQLLARDYWTVVYGLGFALLTSLAHYVWHRRRPAERPYGAYVVGGLLGLSVLAFLGDGLYTYSELRDLHLDALSAGAPGLPGGARVAWRYVGVALAISAAAVLYLRRRSLTLAPALRKALELGLHLAALWLLSSELIHLLRLSGSEVPYRLGITILWGGYAMLLVLLGLLWRRAHLRLAAITLFAVTVGKLFVYDLADLSTISKTVVLVVLGVTILLASFLFARFRDRIAADEP